MDTMPGVGLTFRHYQGEQDLPVMLDVFWSLKIEDHENVLQSLADMTNKYHSLTNCDPYRDVLIAEGNGQMAAYGRVNWRQLEETGERIYTMEWWVRPEWHGQGLEKAFLRQSQERIREIIRQEGSDFQSARLFEVAATSLQPELIHLLEEDGFQAARWGSQMTCCDLQAIPDAPMPEGLEVRPARPEHYRQIWDALLDGFHDDPGYSQPSEEEFAAWQQSSQFQPDLWQIAWDGDQVIAMVLNYITHHPADPGGPGIAWTEDICVRRPWRRRGLARALLARSMGMFREMGYTQTSLGVDLNNAESAPLLYKSMGYQIDHLFTIYRKPVEGESLSRWRETA